MKSQYTAVALALATLALTSGPLLAAPRINADQARKIVLQRYPHSKVVGKVSYENEEKGWEYSVMLQTGKQLQEIMVDANTGKIVSVENTNAAEESSEKGQ